MNAHSRHPGRPDRSDCPDRPDHPGRPGPRALRGAVVLAIALACAACGGAHVKPWDRDLLAKPEMRFAPCPMISAIDQHIYFSKEASMGGAEIGGGGCGCN